MPARRAAHPPARGQALAAGIARRADSIGKIHQRLRKIRRALGRQNFVIPGADLGLRGGKRRRDREITRQHTFNIAIHNRAVTAKGDGGDGAGRIGADPGKSAQALDITGKPTFMFGTDNAGGAVQVACPRVIAKPGPGGHHLILLGGGQIADFGPAPCEVQEIGITVATTVCCSMISDSHT